MTTEVRPAHSPLGASGAERWMNCPGSVALLKLLTLDESDDPDYRKLGTHAHALAALCLESGADAWEHAGSTIEDIEVSLETVEAVQLYLDTVRSLPDLFAGTLHFKPGTKGWDEAPVEFFIEYPVSSPVHKDFYGTLDNAIVAGDTAYINDYKHGEGIAVDVEYNPQLRYYGWAVIQDRPEIRRVVYRIIQPRGFHPDGRVRVWEESADDLRTWVRDELVPAMLATEVDGSLDAGPWCRFCPAKLVCPLLTSLFRAAATANPKEIVNLSDESLGRSYQYVQAAKFYLKAMEDETFNRLNRGREVDGVKLVHKKANRVWKDKAAVLFKEQFGDDAFTKPELLSPAAMAEISPAAKALVTEWAYTPESGLTVALETDKRLGVKVKATADTFAAAIGSLTSDPA
jgi:hypothetical protein